MFDCQLAVSSDTTLDKMHVRSFSQEFRGSSLFLQSTPSFSHSHQNRLIFLSWRRVYNKGEVNTVQGHQTASFGKYLFGGGKFRCHFRQLSVTWNFRNKGKMNAYYFRKDKIAVLGALGRRQNFFRGTHNFPNSVVNNCHPTPPPPPAHQNRCHTGSQPDRLS